MSKRYEITTSWQTADRDTFQTDNGPVILLREYADMRSIRDGYEYSQGAWRVRAFHQDTGKSHTRSKTFYGELAWTNSLRMFDDVVLKARYGL